MVRKLFKGLRKFILFFQNIPASFSRRIQFVLFLALFGLLIFWATYIFQNHILGADIWLHLKSGQYILTNFSVPTKDIFSFTKAGYTWFDHEWLFQVIVYMFYLLKGTQGIILLKQIIFIFIIFFLYLTLKSEQNRIFLAGLMFLLVGVSLMRSLLRPDIFSLFFVTVYLYFLEKKYNTPWVYLLVFFQLLWVNIHGYFFLGPLLILIFIIEYKLQSKPVKLLFIIFIFSCLVNFINPYGIEGAFYPFLAIKKIFNPAYREFLKEVVELAPSIFSPMQGAAYYRGLIFLIIISFAIGRQISFKNVMLSIFFIIFSYPIRNSCFLAVIAVYLIITQTERIYKEIKNINGLNIIAGIILIIIIYPLIMSNIKKSFFLEFVLKNKEIVTHSSFLNNDLIYYPKDEVKYLYCLKPNARLFNDFNSGAYLTFHAPEGYKVFIDGRTEFYGPEFLKEYNKMSKGDGQTIEKVIKQYNLQGFFISYRLFHNIKLIKYLLDNNWKVVVFGDTAVILVKNPEIFYCQPPLLPINLANWQPEKYNLADIWGKYIKPSFYLMRAAILKDLEYYQAALATVNEVIRILPSYSNAYLLRAQIYYELKKYSQAYENLYQAYFFGQRSVTLYVTLAKVSLELFGVQKAEEYINQGLKKYPHNSELLRLKANLKENNLKKSVD